jgi:broad specificity phosphatase PhoE
MTQLEAVRERYLKDGFETRLGGLAANLARLASFAGRMKNHESVDYLLDESKWFIEWTAPDAEPELQAELVQLQIVLAVWQRAWRKGTMDGERLQDMIARARDWSDRLLDRSGLLKGEPS